MVVGSVDSQASENGPDRRVLRTQASIGAEMAHQHSTVNQITGGKTLTMPSHPRSSKP